MGVGWIIHYSLYPLPTMGVGWITHYSIHPLPTMGVGWIMRYSLHPLPTRDVGCIPTSTAQVLYQDIFEPATHLKWFYDIASDRM